MHDDFLKLVGRRLIIQVSDPWEFGIEVGTSPIHVIVEQVRALDTACRDGVIRAEEVLVRVERPFSYKNHKCEFFRATPRHVGASFASLRNGDSIPANFSRTSGIDKSVDANIGLIGSICEDRPGVV